jgi:phosphoribosylformylglycinamidine synthase
MDGKGPGDLLLLVGTTTAAMGGSHYEMLFGLDDADARLPVTDLHHGPRAARAVHNAIAQRLVRAAHDCSEGGLLVAAAEMAFAGDLGLHLDLATIRARGELSITAECFAETPGRYLLEIRRADLVAVDQVLGDVPFTVIGEFDDSATLTLAGADVEIDTAELRDAWRAPLDW